MKCQEADSDFHVRLRMSGAVPPHMSICLEDMNKEDYILCHPSPETICTSSLLAQVPTHQHY